MERISIKHTSAFTDMAYDVQVGQLTFMMHTFPSGGLWVQNVQVEGTTQFRPGTHPDAAIRRWLSSRRGKQALTRLASKFIEVKHAR